MIETIIAIFLLGYLFIALEHTLKIDKAASAIITGILCWTTFVLFYDGGPSFVYKELQHHLVQVSIILHLDIKLLQVSRLVLIIL